MKSPASECHSQIDAIVYEDDDTIVSDFVDDYDRQVMLDFLQLKQSPREIDSPIWTRYH